MSGAATARTAIDERGENDDNGAMPVDVDPAAFPPLVLALLALAAFVAGFVDAIAGGGGLLTVPALLSTSLPVASVLGTNKAQAVWGTLAALVRYARGGLIDTDRAAPAFVAALVGAVLGTRLVLVLPSAWLRPLLLALLVLVTGWLAWRRGASSDDVPVPRPPHARARASLVAFALGGYDGFFGPGTGTLLILAHARFLGDRLDRASANAKVVNAASNLASLATFALRGVVVWKVALPMALAQFAGGWLGSHTAIRHGAPLVRRLVLVVVMLLAAKVARDLLLGA